MVWRFSHSLAHDRLGLVVRRSLTSRTSPNRMGSSPLSRLLPRSLPRNYYHRLRFVAPPRPCGAPRVIVGMVSLWCAGRLLQAGHPACRAYTLANTSSYSACSREASPLAVHVSPLALSLSWSGRSLWPPERVILLCGTYTLWYRIRLDCRNIFRLILR